MIPVKQAVKSAVEFAGSLWEDLAWVTRSRLEEVEKGEVHGRTVWLVTLSIPAPDADFLDPKRLYKVCAVDAETGEPLSMKIREFAGVHD
ncbi:MAG: hypothetical protein ABIR70_07795 [Bryobacteraceae bacterium]